MRTYANEIEQGDRLASGQTFYVADDSGLNIAGQDYTLAGTHTVEHVEYAGQNFYGVEQTRVSVRSSGTSLLIPLLIMSSRLVRTV